MVNSLTELAKAPGPNVRASLDQALDCIVLAEEPTTWVEEFRVILFSALNPEVADVISDFFEQKRQAFKERLEGPDKGTKTDVAFSLLMGSAVVLTLLNRNNYSKKNLEDLRNSLGLMLDQLFALGAVSKYLFRNSPLSVRRQHAETRPENMTKARLRVCAGGLFGRLLYGCVAAA